MMPHNHVDLRDLEAFLFDLDGMVTRMSTAAPEKRVCEAF